MCTQIDAKIHFSESIHRKSQRIAEQHSSSQINWAKLYTYISYANWPRFLDLPMHHCIWYILYSMIGLESTPFGVRDRWSGGRKTTCRRCSAPRGFSEARVRPCWRLSRREHQNQYTSLYKCLIDINFEVLCVQLINHELFLRRIRL